MELMLTGTGPDTIRAGYICPCGCTPSVDYQRGADVATEGCCCGNQFAVGPGAGGTLAATPGFRSEVQAFQPGWGEPLEAAWLVGPSVHGPAEGDPHDHDDDEDLDPTLLPVSPVPSGAPSTRIVVQLTDALRIDPGVISVPAGVPVTFVVTNAGAIEHEFFIGDEAAQSKHESEMQMAGMHEDPNGITLKAGETKELTHVFVGGGSNIAGCHVVGHYGGGMKATITVAG